MIFKIIPVFFLNLKCIKQKGYVAGDDITLSRGPGKVKQDSELEKE